MINYIVPEEELAPVLLKEQLAVYIDFPAGGVQVNPKYGNNSAELAKLEGHLKTLLQSADGFVKTSVSSVTPLPMGTRRIMNAWQATVPSSLKTICRNNSNCL